jgi:hypothetical protein
VLFDNGNKKIVSIGLTTKKIRTPLSAEQAGFRKGANPDF